MRGGECYYRKYHGLYINFVDFFFNKYYNALGKLPMLCRVALLNLRGFKNEEHDKIWIVV